MPRGFTGRPSTLYLTQATTAHKRAVDTTSTTSTRVSDNAPGSANTASRLRVRQLPFEADEGNSGTLIATGRGNSSNIVVSQSEYAAVTRLLSQSDERVGGCLYNVSNEIELLCQTAFILPDAVPRCLNISDTVKRSLGQFRAVTEDAVLQTQRFAREINDIGW